jgi:uncharacterized membrane protein
MPASLRRARGSIIVNTAIALSLIIITLIGTEIGFMYFMKREFQKTADLAALAGAQQIRGGCPAATTAAQLNANGATASDPGRNMPVGLAPLGGTEVQCGYWDKATSFQTPAATGPANAVRVSFARSSPALLASLFTGNRTISVTAVAALSAPLAVFSVGSTLIKVNGDSLLGRALKGIGLDLSGTSLVGYDGLAQVQITPGGLLAALNIPVAANISVGDLNALLAANTVSLGQLLNAIVTVAGQSGLVSSNVTLLNAITTQLGVSNLNVQLGSLTNPPTGLFAQLTAPAIDSANGALNIGVNAMDLIYAAIGVGTSQHAVTIPGAGLSLAPLATVTAQASVIEPPSIGIGGVGATAFTAQIRTFLHVQANLAGLITLDLPIILDAVTGQGTITKMCTPDLQSGGQDRANIEVIGSILRACVGQVAGGAPFSTTNACVAAPMQMVDVLGLLKVNGAINLNGLPTGPYELQLAQGQTQSTPVNPLALGTFVADLTSQVSNLLLGGLSSTSSLLPSMTNQLWGNTSTICSADTSACRGQRYASVLNTIRQDAAQSGLLTGVLNGVTDLVASLANGCTGLLGIGGSQNGCLSMIQSALNSASNSSLGGLISNALSVLIGLLTPILNALGSQLLTPVLQNALGINIGQIDVNLRSLECNPLPMLVY